MAPPLTQRRQEQTRASKQSTAIGSTIPTMGEPSIAGPPSPGGGLHNEGNPGAEEIWGAATMSSGLAGASTEPAGDASGEARAN